MFISLKNTKKEGVRKVLFPLTRNFFTKIYTKNLTKTMFFTPILSYFFKIKKALANGVFTPLTRVFLLRRVCTVLRLIAHLLCNFSSKIFLFLFDTFTGFETNEALNCNFSVVCFCNRINISFYVLFSVFCFYIDLV